MFQKILFSLLFFSLSSSLQATTYYLDNTLPGRCTDTNFPINNACSGYTCPSNSQTSPWCHLETANCCHSSGDTVIIRGEFRSSLFPKPGTSNQHTVYRGATSNPADATILGSDEITGWAQHSGNVWVANLNRGQIRCQRFESAPAWAPDCQGNDCKLYSPDCFEDRTKWFIRADLSTSISGFRAASGPADVNAPGKFYYDYQNQRVYLWTFDSQPPSTHKIECSRRYTAPFSEYRNMYWPSSYAQPNYVTISNLTIMHSIYSGIDMGSLVHHAEITNNEIKFNSGPASCVENIGGIYHGRGVCDFDVTGEHCYNSNINIRNNIIRDQGTDIGPAGFRLTNRIGGGASGIEFYHITDSTIEGNTIYRANNGIFLKTENKNLTIRNNTISDVYQGLYIYPAVMNTLVEGNRFYDGPNPPPNFDVNFVAVWHGGTAGAFSNQNLRLYNNTFYNFFQGLRLESGIVDGTLLRNNIFQNINEEFYLHNYNGASHLSTSNNNLFYDPSLGFNSHSFYCNASTFDNWKSSCQLDINSLNGSNAQFVSVASKDFALQSTSPARNAGAKITGFHCGTCGQVAPGCRTWYGTNPDIGALEYQESCPGDTSPPAAPQNVQIN